jgi:hypothetical protein
MIKYTGLMREEARGCRKGRTAKAFTGNFRGAHRISHGRECMSGIFPLAKTEATPAYICPNL